MSDANNANVANALRSLPDATEAIARWVRAAEGDDLDLQLRAVDLTVRASTERVTITGSIPLEDVDAAAPVNEPGRLLRAPFAVRGSNPARGNLRP